MNKAFNYTPKFNQAAMDKRLCQALDGIITSMKKDTLKTKRAHKASLARDEAY